MNKIFQITSALNQQERDYYCSYKFRYLKIDLASKTTYNCHAAAPHRVDFEWLSKNPGQLFNDEINVAERAQMLNNERNKSCERNCWTAEDNGAISPRIYHAAAENNTISPWVSLEQKDLPRPYTNPISKPEIIDITLGSDCNLTCSYCCKEFSSSWRRDIIKNGNYDLTNYNDGRYSLTAYNQVMNNISQKKLITTDHYQMLLGEFFGYLPEIKRLVITGGEPFLNNVFFDEFCERNTNLDLEIALYTGLHVSRQRLSKILDKLKKFKNLTILVSAEGIGDWLEFNRYGIKWQDFLANLELIKSKGMKIKFHITASVLTIFGLVEFAKFFKDENQWLTFSYQPRFISLHNLDTLSKQIIKEQLVELPLTWQEQILKSISAEPDEQDRVNLGEFLTQFVERRKDISLDIFPKHFLDWVIKK